MQNKTPQQVFGKILEKYGGKIADTAKVILLDDPSLKELQEPLKFISNNWRDLTPALMSLSCQAVGGNSEDTRDAALALSLMNLSFTIWDDIVDNAKFKAFKPTVFGKFGPDVAIIVGGIASAKAFTILNQSKLQNDKRKAVGKLIWNLWSKMATAEVASLTKREQGKQSSKTKLWKMRSEAIDLATSLKLGAVIGNGSNTEIEHLFTYGKYLSMILALTLDFQVSANLTVELAEKIKANRLPYCVFWAAEHSTACRMELEKLKRKENIEPYQMRQATKSVLDTGVLCHISKIMNIYKKKGELELSYIKVTETSRLLKSLLETQHDLLR